jgi:hypothetical protein
MEIDTLTVLLLGVFVCLLLHLPGTWDPSSSWVLQTRSYSLTTIRSAWQQSHVCLIHIV